ncbi:Transmembrane secretion effector [Parafrankia irregularis]|uniref:Transmembrane secretion effector n=1 Tax=Parafrankia irregularis TaxID=795642 RepID=A0A0S4QZK3_9ACTN|nr:MULTISPECIES: MFS transporter [Parafrankia]MBE3204878.1 MFS transporter [Parafrankia sp. CH37]CUU60649.1 Transmembrane secretion effector [Parafrankia irregularis]
MTGRRGTTSTNRRGTASSGRRGPGRAVRGLLADLTPLRTYPAFRRLWVGESVSTIGTQITATAVAVQVYDLTRSSFLVGVVSLVALLPLVGLGLIGGAIADSVDRRRLALVTSTGLAAVSGGLVLFSLFEHGAGGDGGAGGGGGVAAGLGMVWPLLLLVAVQSAFAAVDGPARRAMTPNLVGLGDLPAATALTQIGFTTAMTVGPLIAGTSVALGGYPLAYALDLASFSTALYGLFRLPPMPPAPALAASAPAAAAGAPGAGAASAGPAASEAASASELPAGGRRVASVGEGLRFLRGQPVVMMTFVVDIIAMVFGMPRALFPELASTQFGGGSATAGLLYSSVAAGSLLGAALSGPLGRVRRQGLAVVVAIVVWGGAIAVFGLVHNVVAAVGLLAVAGMADLVSAVFRNAILNVATPDAMRGRLQGVFLVVVSGGPRIGDLEAGTAAALVSPTFSVVSGGLACIGGVLLATAAVPALARYDATAAIAAAQHEAAVPSPRARDDDAPAAETNRA